MTYRFISAETREAAVADYFESSDSLTDIAARHGISRRTLSELVRGPGAGDIAYHGGWEVRGGIQRPLLPERRSA